MVLDEVMAKAIMHKGYSAVTVELNVRFKKPARPDTEYLLKGKVTEVRGKIIRAEGDITGPDNESIASATSRFFMVQEDNEG